MQANFTNFGKKEVMATVGNIRNSLINKILAIGDKEVLLALDKLAEKSENDIVRLTDEQKIMLEMSEDDITHGRVISQKEMFSKEREWLNKQ